MSLEKDLFERANAACELCRGTENLSIHTVAPRTDAERDTTVLCCATCLSQLEGSAAPDPNHWRCLNDSMWSDVAAVKVLAWRMLHQLKGEGWPLDLLDSMYMEDETLLWAKETQTSEEEMVQHKDCNGALLAAGDNVVLIKDLNVKGAGFTAKRGTAVRNISLVHDNATQIEGKVNGQLLVILTQFVKKS